MIWIDNKVGYHTSKKTGKWQKKNGIKSHELADSIF